MAARVTSLNIISPDVEGLFFGAVARCAVFYRASSLDDLRALLEGRLRVEENSISCRLSLALSAVSSFVRV
jgi:hypothetical protein